MTTHYVAKRNGRKIPRYRCTVTFKTGWQDCPHREVNADKFEAWVLGQIEGLSLDAVLLEHAVARANAASAERERPLKLQLRQVAERKKVVQGLVDNFLDAIGSGGRRALRTVEAKLAMEEQTGPGRKR
jgi:ribulose kinase